MKKALSLALQVSVYLLGSLCVSPNIAQAQVTSDGTVNTQVDRDGSVTEITGGETRGDNLFHSFEDFSVPTDNEAFFNNASDIANIFSRVTGGNISNIDGLIRANDSASLFLINPAGIVFGNNARLDIGGSFYGSSASSILFEGGEFSAVDLDNPPLLTVNAPIGLGFRSEPGDIENNSTGDNGNGLEVETGNNIALLGSNIRFNGGRISAPGGNVQLGSLTDSGTLGILENGRFSFPNNIERGNISLINSAGIGVFSEGGGSIGINTKNLEITSGSFISAGIASNLGSPDAQAGDITINATDSILVEGIDFDFSSGIINRLFNNAIGNSGDIEIITNSLSLVNGGLISTNLSGQGSAGDVNITVSDEFTIDGQTNSNTGLFNLINANGIGSSADIDISTETLTISNSGQINSNIFGSGNTGSIEIEANNSISLTNNGFIVSDIQNSGIGNIASITINSPNLTLNEGSFISTSAFSNGDAGNISINSEIINISRDENTVKTGIYAEVKPETFPLDENNEPLLAGNGGIITITTSQLNLSGSSTAISTARNSKGNAGNISINATESIRITDSAELLADTNGIVSTEVIGTDENPILVDSFSGSIGNSGRITIDTPNLNIDGGVISVNNVGEGNAGFVNINTNNFSLSDGGEIRGDVFGIGNGGEITIQARTIEILDSIISSNLGTSSEGSAGNISINTNILDMNGSNSEISASSSGNGSAGNLEIVASESIAINDGAGLFADIFTPDAISDFFEPTADGNGGNINIETSNLSLNDRGKISVSNSGRGSGGNLTINTDTLNLNNNSQLNASLINNPENSEGVRGGSITINANDSINLSEISVIGSSVDEGSVGNGGDINISTDILNLTTSFITTSIFSSGQGNAGDLKLQISDSININDGSISSTVNENARGNSGSINLTTHDLNILGGSIRVSNLGTGATGNLTLNTNSIFLDNQTTIDAITTNGSEGNLFITSSNDIILRNDSIISARAFNQSNGGNLTIDSRFIIAFPNGNNDIIASAEQGEGGNITINAESLLGIQERTPNDSTNDINASSRVSGLDGIINIATPDINPVQGTTELPTNVVEPRETTEQACQANREALAKGGLNILGKGGIVPDPALPLNSLNAIANGENTPTSSVPAPIETAQGKIQPARGIKVTKSGGIILTAYHTNNAGERISDRVSDCSGV